jgi:hypothetical protein
MKILKAGAFVGAFFVLAVVGLKVVSAQTAGTLIPSDTFLNFSVVQGQSNPPVYNLHLTNGSAVSVNYNLSAPNQPAWLNSGYATQTLTLNSGGVVGVGVSVDATKVSSPGTYTTNLVVSGNFTNSPLTIPITLTVTAPATPSLGTLIPSDTFVNFSVVQGQSNPPVYNLHITNTSAVSVTYTQSVPNQPSWLNCQYNTQPMTLSAGGVMGTCVAVDATKVSNPGTYTANLVLTGNFTNSPITIPITLTVTAPATPSQGTIIPSDTFVNFSVVQGQANPPVYNLHLTNGSSIPVNFTMSVPNQPGWLNCQYNTQPMTISASGVMGICVAVDATKVSSPGTYNTNLIFSGNFTNSPITVPVTLTVTSAAQTQSQMPTISYINPTSGTGNTPVTIYGTYLAGATAVNFYNANNQVSMGIAQQNISVSSNGSSLSFTIDNVANGMLGTGTYQVKVVTPAGTSNGESFAFTPTTVLTTPVACPALVPYCPYGSYTVAQSNGCAETICNSAPSTTGSGTVTTPTPVTGSNSNSSSVQALQQELV